MKALIYSFMVFLSASTLLADPGIGGGFLDALMVKNQPHTDQAPFVDQKNIFEHADVTPVLKSQAEVLEGEGDLVGVMSKAASKGLETATVPSSDVRVAFQKEETEEDLAKFGPVSEQKPNGDESLANAELDLKLRNSNPSALNTVRRAEPADHSNHL